MFNENNKLCLNDLNGVLFRQLVFNFRKWAKKNECPKVLSVQTFDVLDHLPMNDSPLSIMPAALSTPAATPGPPMAPPTTVPTVLATGKIFLTTGATLSRTKSHPLRIPFTIFEPKLFNLSKKPIAFTDLTEPKITITINGTINVYFINFLAQVHKPIQYTNNMSLVTISVRLSSILY